MPVCGATKSEEFGAGIVLYFMLSKSTPFLAPTPAMTIEKTMEGKAATVHTYLQWSSCQQENHGYSS